MCQNCKSEFHIDPEDFSFYEKMKVPPPTWCPECRLRRRLSFENIFHLYRSTCALCGKEVMSRYSPDKGYTIHCPHCWWGDGWDATDYGRDYDFSRPFFEQFRDLWHTVPMVSVSVDLPTSVESLYTNDAGYLKQCYLLFTAVYSERCMYGYYIGSSADCSDAYLVQSCEMSYDIFHGYKNYRGVHFDHTITSRDSAMLWQCVNSDHCFASANLRNKSYHIFNKPYTPEQYEEEMREYDLGSYRNYERIKKEAHEHWLKYPVKVFWREFSRDSTGLYVHRSKNCRDCFEVTDAEDSRYVSFQLSGPIKDAYDYTTWGDNAELIYECVMVGEQTRNIRFGAEAGLGLSDAQYVLGCIGASDLFGCVGVHKKSYCILNKQYTKEEYEAMVPRIIAHMNDMPYTDAQGRIYRYGEFFPPDMSPFAYNETMAHVYDPLTPDTARAAGYFWKELEKPAHPPTLAATDIPDHIRDAGDDILRQIIGCASCGRPYRLIPQELALYRNLNVPVPRHCFYCRLGEKLARQPHPLRRVKRTCQCTGDGSDNGVYHNENAHDHGVAHCAAEVETYYASGRPEIIYCEACYQQEVV